MLFTLQVSLYSHGHCAWQVIWKLSSSFEPHNVNKEETGNGRWPLTDMWHGGDISQDPERVEWDGRGTFSTPIDTSDYIIRDLFLGLKPLCLYIGDIPETVAHETSSSIRVFFSRAVTLYNGASLCGWNATGLDAFILLSFKADNLSPKCTFLIF